jgi:hypothetical protein
MWFGPFALSGLCGRWVLRECDVGAVARVAFSAATDPAVRGSQFYGPDGMGGLRGHPRVVDSSPRSHDGTVQQRLWAVSEDLTGVHSPSESDWRSAYGPLVDLELVHVGAGLVDTEADDPFRVDADDRSVESRLGEVVTRPAMSIVPVAVL